MPNAFLWSFAILFRQSIIWDLLLGEKRECCFVTAPRDSWEENEHRVPHTHSLPTSVARASRMLLDKHHLCGHTLFYELSHQPGWLLKCCCLNLQAEENKKAWSAIWQNFMEGSLICQRWWGICLYGVCTWQKDYWSTFISFERKYDVFLYFYTLFRKSVSLELLLIAPSIKGFPAENLIPSWVIELQFII